MKAKEIIINIPKPCHEDWQKMSNVEKGRHCQVCEKTVVDFTTMNDSQIFNFYQKNNQKICGRFYPSQIGKPISAASEMRFSLPVVVLASAVLALSSCNLNPTTTTGEIAITPPKTESSCSSNATMGAVMPREIMGKIALHEFTTIKGKITDSEGSPIEKAYILLENTDLTSNTDKKGKFELAANFDFSKKESYTLTVIAVGYENQDFILTKQNINTVFQVKMTPQITLMGDTIY